MNLLWVIVIWLCKKVHCSVPCAVEQLRVVRGIHWAQLCPGCFYSVSTLASRLHYSRTLLTFLVMAIVGDTLDTGLESNFDVLSMPTHGKDPTWMSFSRTDSSYSGQSFAIIGFSGIRKKHKGTIGHYSKVSFILFLSLT